MGLRTERGGNWAGGGGVDRENWGSRHVGKQALETSDSSSLRPPVLGEACVGACACVHTCLSACACAHVPTNAPSKPAAE